MHWNICAIGMYEHMRVCMYVCVRVSFFRWLIRVYNHRNNSIANEEKRSKISMIFSNISSLFTLNLPFSFPFSEQIKSALHICNRNYLWLLLQLLIGCALLVHKMYCFVVFLFDAYNSSPTRLKRSIHMIKISSLSYIWYTYVQFGERSCVFFDTVTFICLVHVSRAM